jgi:hypothetical protein
MLPELLDKGGGRSIEGRHAARQQPEAGEDITGEGAVLGVSAGGLYRTTCGQVYGTTRGRVIGDHLAGG